MSDEMPPVGNDRMPSTYAHTQRSPLGLLLYAVGIAFVVVGFTIRDQAFPSYLFLAMGVLILVLAASMQHLTVADEEDRLSIRFGPLPLFSRHVRYEDVHAVKVGRTWLLDGWGIHFSLRCGWVWNDWGRDRDIVRLRRGLLVVGTDDPENLADFIQQRVPVSAG